VLLAVAPEKNALLDVLSPLSEQRLVLFNEKLRVDIKLYSISRQYDDLHEKLDRIDEQMLQVAVDDDRDSTSD